MLAQSVIPFAAEGAVPIGKGNWPGRKKVPRAQDGVFPALTTSSARPIPAGVPAAKVEPETDSMAIVVILAKSAAGSARSGEFISKNDRLREREWALELVEPVREERECLWEPVPFDEFVACTEPEPDAEA